MKASLKFRDDHRSPLVRMKFPLSAPGINLSSGIVFGDAQDLSLHIGTPAEASCPSMKFSYHPNDPSNAHFCLVVKMGMGPWGPPNMASLSVSAQLRFSRVSSSGPFFSIHVKPMLGDFGLRKMVKLSSSSDSNSKATVEEDWGKHGVATESGHLGMNNKGGNSLNCRSFKTIDVNTHGYVNTFDTHRNNVNGSHGHGYLSSYDEHRDKSIDINKKHGNELSFDDYRCKDMALNSHEVFDEKITHAVTPLKLDNNSLFTPLPLRSKPQNGLPSSTSDCWANGFAKHDDFDHTYRSDRMASFESYSDHHASELESPHSSSVEGSSIMHERGIEIACSNNNNNSTTNKTVRSLPVPLQLGSHESMRGWALHAYSMVPLGKQAALSFRWGVKMYGNGLEGCDTSSPNVKLPFLCLQKISISSRRCKNIKGLESGALQILGKDEEIYELSPVTSLCGLMKKQVHMLYTENQGLKKAMKEMKAQFEQEIIGKPRSLRGTASGDSNMDERIETPAVAARERKGATMKPRYSDGRNLLSERDSQFNEKNAPKKFSFFRWFCKRRS